MVVTDQQEILLAIGNPTYFDLTGVQDYLSRWPEADGAVDKVTVDHVLEYISGSARVFFINELYRVLKTGGQAILKLPYWTSPNAFADPYVCWPPITEMSLQYLADKDFRERNNIQYPGFDADFYLSYGYSYSPEWHIRSDATRDYAVSHNIGVVTQVTYCLTKK